MRTFAMPFALLALMIVGAACAGTAPATSSPDFVPIPSAGGPTASPLLDVSPAPSAVPSPTPSFRHGAQGLVDDLIDLGRDAELSGAADGQPLANEQLIVCTGGEDVRVFSYSTEADRAAASRRIDPDDPSNVGTAIVEWAGSPKFWQRDRIIVLYLGTDEMTVDALTALMGEPFARGEGRPPMLPSSC
jgi:hypothetical protein